MSTDRDWLDLARLGLTPGATPEAMLWDELDLTDAQARRFGDFDLLERIGRGGMGVVFRARQHSLGREVAIKFIVGALADDPRAIATFLAEARAAAKLHHPHIVPVFETGAIEGMHFFSMPLLRGDTLAQRLAAQPMAPADAVPLMLKLCAAVDYAHGFGLLHLDLKPGNVLFDRQGEPLIGDFGLARSVDADGGVSVVDASGTAAYMAPEQLGDATSRLTRRTDVYALGAMLHEILLGDPPHHNVDAAALRTIDVDLAAIVLHCLHADPVQRYASVAEFGADLARYRDGNAVSVRAPSRRERAVRTLRQHPALTLGVAVAVITLSLGLLATGWQWRRAELQATRNRDLAGFMAAAFPAGKAVAYGRSDNARAAVAWLKQHAADPAAQRAVLGAFRQALGDADKGDAVAALTNEIIDQLGAGYREEQVQRLLRKGDRDSLIAAALLGIPRGDEVSSAAHDAVLETLLREHSDDALALYAAALACHVQPRPCLHPAYFEALVSRFPDNAVHWVLTPHDAAIDDTRLIEHIRAASKATTFDDRVPILSRLLADALRDQPVPPSIEEPMRAVLDDSAVASALRRNATDSVALPFYRDFLTACQPLSAAMKQAPSLRDECGRFAQLGMHSTDASILGRMIASAMLRRLFKGTSLETEAKEYRREYVWLSTFTPTTPEASDALQRDLVQFGEWEAWQRQAERAGAPRSPPAAWVPENPQALLLSEERTPAK